MTHSIARIISQTLEIQLHEISDETGPDNQPKWDSLGAVRLLLALQEAFDVEFTQTEVMAMRSVALIRRILRKRGIDAKD